MAIDPNKKPVFSDKTEATFNFGHYMPKDVSLRAYFHLYNPDISLFTKPIYLYTNPNKIDFSYKQKITRTKTRAGWVEEYWGEEIDNIKAEGVTGGFFTISGGYTVNIFKAYTETLDIDEKLISKGEISAAYEAFKRLLYVYRNNGSLSNRYDDSGEAFGAFTDYSPIIFSFDNYNYYGYFEEFSVDYSDDKPFMFTYSFSFKAVRTEEIYS